MVLNTIGLETQNAKALAQTLNLLLANLQVFYQNLRGLHWNIKGEQFFQLHAKFEELYMDTQEKVDLVAERILTLGATPFHTFEEYIDNSSIPIGKNVNATQASVELTLTGLKSLLSLERDILSQASEANDEGTVSMMSDFISFQEKTSWMLQAFLG